MSTPVASEPTSVVQSDTHAGSLSGERRQVTALFYDIVGSTKLLNSLDPEDFANLQRSLHTEAVAAIRQHGGHVDQLQGDGGCAYFGLPVSFEDAAECAVAAALEIVQKCEGLGHNVGATLQVRVGVATGVVVVTERRHTALPDKGEIVGITPTLAARIQLEAEPNGIAVADATYRLTRSAFEFDPIGPRRLKGFDKPLLLWKPSGRRPHADRFSSRRVTAPLIGREDELEFCRNRWERARNGQGQFVFLQGEAGIGKSRLAAQLRKELAVADSDVRVFQCQPRGNMRPLHPFLDNLKRAIHGGSPSASGPDRDAIASYFEAQGSEISDIDADVIAYLFDSRTDNPANGPWSADLSIDESRERAVEAMIAVLSALSHLRPQLIVVEDLHWADTFTEAVVARLADAIASLPILVIATSRQDIPANVVGHPNALAISLSRLGAAATSQLVNSIWDEPPPDELAAFIYDKSEGVPLFAEELVSLLKESSVRVDSSVKSWERLLHETGVLTLQDLIAARLAGLRELRHAAQIASVIGREFRLDLLSRIVDTKTLPCALDETLQKLVRAGIVQPTGAGEGMSYRFRHVLIQEAAYDSLLKADRRELHKRIASLITSGEVAVPPEEIVAWHCAQAGRPLEAAQHAIRAAEACVARSAMPEADRLLSFAQEQLDQCGSDADGANTLLLQLLMLRGPVAAALFGPGAPQTCAVYERGVALCQEDDGDRAKWFPLYWGWWFTSPNYQVEQARSEILVRELEKTADTEVRLQSLHCAWVTNFIAGRHSYCLKCIREGLALYNEERARWSRSRYGGHDAKVCALSQRALSLWFSGDDQGSTDSLDAAMRWAERIGHPGSMFHVLMFAIELRAYQNDHGALVTLANRMATDHAWPEGNAKAKLFRGWARALTGFPAEGLAEFEEGFAQQREIGTEENLSVHNGMRAEILARAGRYDEALEILNAAIESFTRAGQLFWLPELYRRRALLRVEVNQSAADALFDIERALALAEEQGAASLIARARADIDRLGPFRAAAHP